VAGGPKMPKVNEISIILIINLAKTVKKPASERVMENVQMQGFRNPEE
jgi:hypothetical protein